MPAPDNYYDDSPGSAASGDSSPMAEKPQDGEDDDGKTSILPKSFFHKEVKPGDTCDVRVVAVHDDDVEVECGGEGEEKPDDDGGGEPPEAPAPSEGSMASMME